MKYIVLIIGLLVVGCGKTETERLEEEKWTQEYETEFQISEDENKRLKAEIESNKIEAENKKKKDDLLRLSVVGEYEVKEDGNTIRGVFLENGNFESYRNGKKSNEEGKWKISEESDIHFSDSRDGDIRVFRINPDGSITMIAGIRDGKIEDMPKDKQLTFKRIKYHQPLGLEPSKGDDKNSTTAKPVKELTIKDIVGTYEYKAFGSAYIKKFLDNGVVEDYEEVEKKAGRTWKLVDGEIHNANSFGSFTVYRVNSDNSITRIAIIKEFPRGKERTSYGKEFQWTYRKIK